MNSHYEVWWTNAPSSRLASRMCQCFDYSDALTVWDAMSKRFCYVVLYKVLDNGDCVEDRVYKNLP